MLFKLLLIFNALLYVHNSVPDNYHSSTVILMKNKNDKKKEKLFFHLFIINNLNTTRHKNLVVLQLKINNNYIKNNM